MTDEDILNLYRNADAAYQKTVADAMGSYRDKHLNRATNMMLGEMSSAEYLQHLKD